jgi:hypothetical protein
MFVLTGLLAVSLAGSASALTINEDVTIEPGTTPAPEETAVGTPGVPPILQDNGDGTHTVFTQNSTVNVEIEETISGGILAQTNGDATLNPEQKRTETLDYNIYTSFLVDDDTGDPIPGSEQRVAGYIDGSGVLQVLTPSVDDSDPDVENWTIDIASLPAGERDAINEFSDAEPVGGYLVVGGDAQVDGVLTVGDNSIDIDGDEHTITTTEGDTLVLGGNEGANGDGDVQVDADLDVTGELVVDGQNVGDELDQNAAHIAAEETARTDADDAIQADVDQNEADSDAADAAIQADVDQNEADSDAADAGIQADVDQNEADSDAADAAIQADVDQNEADSDAADAAIQADVDQNETDSDAADAVLQDNIDAEEATRIRNDHVLAGLIDDEVGTRTDLIRRDGDGTIHIGADSFILDDTDPVGQGHILGTSDGTPLVLGAGSEDVEIANDLYVGGWNVAAGLDNHEGRIDDIETVDIPRLDGRIDAEAATRAAEVNRLDGRINANAARISQNRALINENRAMIEQNRVTIARLNDKVDEVADKAFGGVAAAATLDTLVPPAPGKTSIMGGVAYYEGSSAVGVNMTHRLRASDTKDVYLNAGVSATTESTVLGRVMAGFEF